MVRRLVKQTHQIILKGDVTHGSKRKALTLRCKDRKSYKTRPPRHQGERPAVKIVTNISTPKWMRPSNLSNLASRTLHLDYDPLLLTDAVFIIKSSSIARECFPPNATPLPIKERRSQRVYKQRRPSEEGSYVGRGSLASPEMLSSSKPGFTSLRDHNGDQSKDFVRGWDGRRDLGWYWTVIQI